MTDNITNDRKKFGDFLQYILKKHKLGQQPLAEYLGTTVGMVSKYATGRNLPSDEKMDSITDFLSKVATEQDIVELNKLFLNASTSIRIVDLQGFTFAERHFLELFNKLLPEQQLSTVNIMLQNIEDNKTQMAQNAGLDK